MITVTVSRELDSCTACGVANYTFGTGKPNGVVIHKIAMGGNVSWWVSKCCAKCLNELNDKIFPFRAGR